MSSSLKVSLALDSSKFNKGIQDAAKQVETFATDNTEAAKAIEKIEKRMARQIDTAKTYSRQVASMREAIVGYTLAYNELSEEMQSSDFGKNMLKRIEELTNKAGELQDAITETSTAIRKQSDGEIMYQATLDGLDLLTSGLQTVIGVNGMFGRSTEEITRALQTMATVQTAANTVTKLTTALQRDSAIAQAAARLATSENTIAVKLGTVAQKAMNAAVKANPYIIAATAILALAAGIYKFVTAETEAEKAAREFNESLETKYVDEYATKMSTSLSTFNRLQVEWNTLKSVSEKNEWIKNNAAEFDKLGISINNINEAQNALVTNADKVIAAIEAEAKAAATAAIYQEAYKKQFEEQIKVQQMSQKEKERYAKDNDIDISSAQTGVNSVTTISGTTGTSFTSTQKIYSDDKLTEIINDNIRKNTESYLSVLDAEYKKRIEAQNEAQAALANAGIQAATKTTKTTTKTATGSPTSMSKPNAVNLDVVTSIPPTTLAQLKRQVNNIKAQMENASADEYIALKVRLESAQDAVKKFEDGAYGSNIDLPKTIEPLSVEQTNAAADELKERARKAFEEMMSDAEKTAQAVSSIGGAFGSVGDIVGGSAGEMLNFFGTAANGAATLIPIIQQMIAAKSAEAMISGTAEGAKMPFPANIVAIATIISTIAGVIASLPKFNDGGVFTGTSIGDMNIARVNGGEMILNNRQQERLFRMLNGDLSSRNDPAPKLETVIRGSDIFLSQKNYTKTKNKTGML